MGLPHFQQLLLLLSLLALAVLRLPRVLAEVGTPTTLSLGEVYESESEEDVFLVYRAEDRVSSITSVPTLPASPAAPAPAAHAPAPVMKPAIIVQPKPTAPSPENPRIAGDPGANKPKAAPTAVRPGAAGGGGGGASAGSDTRRTNGSSGEAGEADIGRLKALEAQLDKNETDGFDRIKQTVRLLDLVLGESQGESTDAVAGKNANATASASAPASASASQSVPAPGLADSQLKESVRELARRLNSSIEDADRMMKLKEKVIQDLLRREEEVVMVRREKTIDIDYETGLVKTKNGTLVKPVKEILHEAQMDSEKSRKKKEKDEGAKEKGEQKQKEKEKGKDGSARPAERPDGDGALLHSFSGSAAPFSSSAPVASAAAGGGADTSAGAAREPPPSSSPPDKDVSDVDATRSGREELADYVVSSDEVGEVLQRILPEAMDNEVSDPALMQEDFVFLKDFVVLVSSATIGGLVAVYLKFPVFVGYIAGGLFVGPSGYAVIQKLRYIETLSQIGGPLLLFVQGLSLQTTSVRPFSRVFSWTLPLQFLANCFFLCVMMLYFDLARTGPEALLLSLCTAVSSSAVSLKIAEDNGHHRTHYYDILVSMAVVQDLAMALLLCLPAAVHQGYMGIFVVMKQMVIATLIVSSAVIAAVKVMPHVARFFVHQNNPELFLLSLTSLCLGAASFTRYIGLSTEFGAFFAGLILTRTSHVKEAIRRIDPIKDVFCAMFFASIGLVISPAFIWKSIDTIMLIFIFMFVFKTATGFVLLRSLGHGSRSATLTSLCLAEIGEFSIFVAGNGFTLGVISRKSYLIFLAVTVFSLVATPVIFKLILFVTKLRPAETKHVFELQAVDIRPKKMNHN